MCAGAVTTLAVQFPAAVLFIATATLPLAWRFARVEHEFGMPFAFLVALFMVMLIAEEAIVRIYHRLAGRPTEPDPA